MLPPFKKPSLASRIVRSPRARALAAWHRVDLEPDETARRDSSKSVGDLVNSVLGEMGLERKRAEAEVANVWNALIDPTVVAHAQPSGVRKGTLFVTVDSSVWLDEIVRYRRREILSKLQNSLGRDMIQRISFRVG